MSGTEIRMRQLRFKEYLVVAAGIIVIALSLSFAHVERAGGGPATVPGTAPVSVMNTPLPVQGTVSVSNFPSTVTGSVSITGTPNVSVVNPATHPALTSSVDNPGRIPYQIDHFVNKNTDDCSTAQDHCSFLLPDVPAGKRLVVQHVATLVNGVDTATYVRVLLQNIVVARSLLLSSFLVPLSPGRGTAQTSVAAGDQAVQFYLDGGANSGLVVSVSTDGDLGPNPQILVGVSGYLLDCAANQCATKAP